MKQKRFRKLLMSQGMSRNQANILVEGVIKNRISYAKAYSNFKNANVIAAFDKLSKAFGAIAVSADNSATAMQEVSKAYKKGAQGTKSGIYFSLQGGNYDEEMIIFPKKKVR